MSHGNETLLIALADAAKASRVHLQIRDAQPAQFGNPQPRRIHQFDHGLVPDAHDVRGVGLPQQPVDLFHAQKLRKALAELRRLDVCGRIIFDHALGERKPEKVPDGDEVTRHRPAIQVPPIKTSEKIHHVLAAHLRHSQSALGGETLQTSPYRGDTPGSYYPTIPFPPADNSEMFVRELPLRLPLPLTLILGL